MDWLEQVFKDHPLLDNRIGYKCLYDAFNNSYDRSPEAIIELAQAYLNNFLEESGYLRKKPKFTYETVD